MSVNQSVTVGTTPTLLYQSLGPDQESVTLDNLTGSDVTIGGPSVVSGSGPQLKSANPPWTTLLEADSVYGICASGTATVEAFAVISSSR